MADTGWKRLGDYVRRERLTRKPKPTQRQFAATMGVSESQLRNIENGYRDRYDHDTITLIEVAMGWHVGSVQRIVAGGNPAYIQDPRLAQFRIAWRRLPPDVQDVLVRLAELFARG